ncbi:hypothetical protein BC643_2947 [Mangrovibacterium diazotrophicum]|uniref:Uncharacterized protein n=1 Tax=Mangrovibacterium diazotrophicum TaxID=1261403 RepID=A0A419WAV1_9BACT|nr:hypothetical protein BC643_2947 [Mangrovibacterium diazotrophicum]
MITVAKVYADKLWKDDKTHVSFLLKTDYFQFESKNSTFCSFIHKNKL